MKRRTVLGSVAGMASLAGCASSEEQEPTTSSVSVRTIELSTEDVTMEIETQMYEGFIGWETQTLARIEQASSNVSSVLLTCYEDSYEVEVDHYLWSIPGEVPGETDLYIDDGDLLEMRVDDENGAFQVSSASVPEMQVPTEAER